jgi:hypothetical protein
MGEVGDDGLARINAVAADQISFMQPDAIFRRTRYEHVEMQRAVELPYFSTPPPSGSAQVPPSWVRCHQFVWHVEAANAHAVMADPSMAGAALDEAAAIEAGRGEQDRLDGQSLARCFP